jgi:hypothetical protein
MAKEASPAREVGGHAPGSFASGAQHRKVWSV